MSAPARSHLALLRTPRWIAGAVLALVGVLVFTNLGLWQLRRLAEVRALNATLEERSRMAPVDLTAAGGGIDPDALALRRVRVAGRYDADAEVVVAGRTLDGRPGNHVLTPLRTDAGSVVWVNRGWVPFELREPPIAPASPPSGAVVVTGVALPSEGGAALPAADGPRPILPRVDLAVLAEQVAGPQAPVYVQLAEQEPAQAGELPVPAALAPPDEGNHLSYAVQWFLFATVVVVGFPLLLRRAARDDAEAATGAS